MNNRTKYIGIITLICLLCLAFTTGDNKSQYSIPRSASSVTAGDLDLDGDIDIVVGHNYNFQTMWSGISYLKNDGEGYLILMDSIFLYSWQTNVFTVNTDNDTFPEIIARHFEDNLQYMAILDYDQNNYAVNLFNMPYGISGNNIGDVNGDSFIDIVLYSNDNQFWGVMYNDGTGVFSTPCYHYVSDYFPTALACEDLNFDNRDDIVICGQSTEVYFSYPGGFELLTLETNDYKEDVAIVDFDLDGDSDIITFVGIPVVNVSSLVMYENLGNNQFDTLPEFYFGQISSRIFVTDFDNDSLQDVLFQLSDNTGFIIYYNQGDFQLADSLFIPVEPYENEGLRDYYCADLDGNGYSDIIITRLAQIALPDNLVILFNDGNGNFIENPVTVTDFQNHDTQNPIDCYPNPFSDKITIEVISSTPVKSLKIFDLKGNLIKTLIDGNIAPVVNKLIWNGKDLNEKPACQWDGTDITGREVKPGIYFVNLTLNNSVSQTQKIIKN